MKSPTLLIALIALASFQATAALFQPDEEVKLLQDAPLYFRESVHREGKKGETLRVILHRASEKKVFVEGRDENGAVIALSVDESLVEIIPPDTQKLREDAVSAVKLQKLEDASRIILRIMKFEPGEDKLPKALEQIERANRAAKEFAAAEETLTRQKAESDRQRRNASVADRPNPLNPGDTSNRDRANSMKEAANRAEQRAVDAVTLAEASVSRALAEIQSLLSPSNGKNSGGKVPGSRTDLQGTALKVEFERLWTDPFVIPEVPILTPSYRETVDFIAKKLAWNEQIAEAGYGKNSKIMLIRVTDMKGTPYSIIGFNPSQIVPTVKTFTQSRREFTGMYERGVVRIEDSTQSKTLLAFPGPAFPAFSPQGIFGSSADLVLKDRLDADKVAKAFSHLAQMFGAKPDPF